MCPCTWVWTSAWSCSSFSRSPHANSRGGGPPVPDGIRAGTWGLARTVHPGLSCRRPPHPPPPKATCPSPPTTNQGHLPLPTPLVSAGTLLGWVGASVGGHSHLWGASLPGKTLNPHALTFAESASQWGGCGEGWGEPLRGTVNVILTLWCAGPHGCPPPCPAPFPGPCWANPPSPDQRDVHSGSRISDNMCIY